MAGSLDTRSLIWGMSGNIATSSRAALIRAGVSEMCDEEVYYWYAKMAGAFESSGANNALKALRVLLAGE